MALTKKNQVELGTEKTNGFFLPLNVPISS
jgi:hypothetical protein